MAPRAGGAEERAARKTLARVEKQLEKVTAAELRLTDQMAAHATDSGRLAELAQEMHALAEEREGLELEWLEAAEVAEGS